MGLRCACGNNQQVGGVAINDIAQLTIKPVAVTILFTDCRDSIHAPVAAVARSLRTRPGKSSCGLALGNTWQPLLFLHFCCRQQDGVCGHADSRQERRAKQFSPHFLQNNGQFHIPHTQATIFLGNRDGLQVQFSTQTRPNLWRVAELLIHRNAHIRRAGDIRQERLNRFANHLLLFSQAKFHGLPSPQLPYTFCAGISFSSRVSIASPTSAGAQRSPLSTPSVLRQPSAIEIFPPSASNTRPVISEAASDASQASREETFSGAQ